MQHDDSPDNTALGVVATRHQATAFTEKINGDFENNVFYGAFPIGVRYTDRASRYRSDC